MAILQIALPAMAESESAFSLQGFGTLGIARTTTDNVEFVRDLSQPRGIGKEWSGLVDSVLGLQGAWHINPQMVAVVQATSRYRYDQTFLPPGGGKAITIVNQEGPIPNYHWPSDTMDNISAPAFRRAVEFTGRLVRRLD